MSKFVYSEQDRSWHMERLFTVGETTCESEYADEIITEADPYGWTIVKYDLNGSDGKLVKLVLLDDLDG